MSITGLLTGTHALVVGIEDDPRGLRIYLDHRARGLYVLATDPEAIADARRAWQSRGHVTILIPPPEFVFSNEDDPEPCEFCGRIEADGPCDSCAAGDS